ncbi:unnamed protein product [Cylindrotheca closterium]|uniref:Uncharacterized protein n=1 Tax=Cylindrotheca closterium TaxID=2856 RepID=A0AAD2CS91_9STRA|nr:unnamed protein product [Cylindrotheca closterium]
MSSSQMTTTEPSASLLSSTFDSEFLLEDEDWMDGPLHCQWGQSARRIAHECLQRSSAGEVSNHDSFSPINHLNDYVCNKTDLATGSLGTFAYLQYELSKHCTNEEHRLRLLTSARDFCHEVLNTESDIKAENDEECDNETPGSMSILTNTEIGAHLLLTVVYNEMDQVYRGRDHLRMLLRIWKQANGGCHLESNDNSKRNNLWYGRAGALQGIFFLRRELYSPTGARDLAIDIAKELLVQLSANSSIDGDDGMILGRIGILYTLLGMEEEEWNRLETEIPGCRQTVQGIIEANYIVSVITDGCDPSWATGVAGQILLLIRASQIFDKELYFDFAKHLTKRYLLPSCYNPKIGKIGLSDGIVGVAFALRYLQQESASERFVKLAMQNLSSNKGSVCGLFDGAGGLVLLLMDMADRIQPSSFPFLHPPSSCSMSLSLPTDNTDFDESGLLAVDNFSFHPKASLEIVQCCQNGTIEPEFQDSNTHLHSNADTQHDENEAKQHRFLESDHSRDCSPSRQKSEPRPNANSDSSNAIQSTDVSYSYDYSSPLRNSPSRTATVGTPPSTPARDSRIPTYSSPSSISVPSQHSNASPNPILKAALRPTRIPTPTKPNSVALQLSRQSRIRTPPRPTAKSNTVQVPAEKSSTKTQSKLRGQPFSNQDKGPRSPPRPNRLGTEYKVISEYQFRDRNGKFGRRIMSRCLDNSTAEGNLLNGGLGPCIYLRLQMSKASENNRTQLLKASLVEAEKALKVAKGRAGAVSQNMFNDEYIGAKCFYIILLHRLGRPNKALWHAEDLLELLRKGCESLPPEACGVLDGRAGVLKTIWFLRSELESPGFGHNLALHISKQIMYQGMLTAQKYKSESLVMWEWKSKPYLGSAHGVVGIIDALLGHSDEEMSILESMLPRVRDVILQAIESLDSCCDDSGNLRKKLNDEDDNDLTNMVHGSPGYCLLLAKASLAFPKKRKEFVLRATRLADSTLRPALQPGRINNANGGLMRGVSGIGYIFLALAQIDYENASKWISKAESIAHHAVDQLDSLISNSRRPYSLFEGIGGLASLLIDLLHPEAACFPFYDVSKRLEISSAVSTNGIQPFDPVPQSCLL